MLAEHSGDRIRAISVQFRCGIGLFPSTVSRPFHFAWNNRIFQESLQVSLKSDNNIIVKKKETLSHRINLRYQKLFCFMILVSIILSIKKIDWTKEGTVRDICRIEIQKLGVLFHILYHHTLLWEFTLAIEPVHPTKMALFVRSLRLAVNTGVKFGSQCVPQPLAIGLKNQICHLSINCNSTTFLTPIKVSTEYQQSSSIASLILSL